MIAPGLRQKGPQLYQQAEPQTPSIVACSSRETAARALLRARPPRTDPMGTANSPVPARR
jgi:hypothetical protein